MMQKGQSTSHSLSQNMDGSGGPGASRRMSAMTANTDCSRRGSTVSRTSTPLPGSRRQSEAAVTNY